MIVMTCNSGDITSGFRSEHLLFRTYKRNTCPTFKNTIQHSYNLQYLDILYINCLVTAFLFPLHTAIAGLTMSHGD